MGFRRPWVQVPPLRSHQQGSGPAGPELIAFGLPRCRLARLSLVRTPRRPCLPCPAYLGIPLCGLVVLCAGLLRFFGLWPGDPLPPVYASVLSLLLTGAGPFWLFLHLGSRHRFFLVMGWRLLELYLRPLRPPVEIPIAAFTDLKADGEWAQHLTV